MLLFNIIGLVVTINIIGLGLYYLFFKKAKNRNSSILGYSYLIAGAMGFLLTMSQWLF